MSIEEAIKAYLVPILSPVPIYFNEVPENTPNPLVVYRLAVGKEHHDIPVKYPTYQFDVYTDRPHELLNISAALINAFKRYKGIMQGIPVIQGVIENTLDIPEQGMYRRTIDIKIIYKEA